jgi:Flp pilus assembly protein TadG
VNDDRATLKATSSLVDDTCVGTSRPDEGRRTPVPTFRRTHPRPARRPVFRLGALRRRTERGAALVEMAIIIIPFSLIVFGIIEYGFIFKDSLTLSSATRAGARTASAEPTDPQFFTDTINAVTKAATAAKFKNGDQLWIYRVDGDTGVPAPCDPAAAAGCNKYEWNGSAFVAISGQIKWTTSDMDACLGGARALDSVGVRLALSHDAISGFFQNMNLHELTVMQLEPQQTC